MKRFKAETASTNIYQGGQPFTEDTLKELCKINPQNCTITLRFDPNNPIGKVLSAKVCKNKVVITGEISISEPGFIVPGGCVHVIGDKIKRYVLCEFGYTTTPMDQSLTPIEYID